MADLVCCALDRPTLADLVGAGVVGNVRGTVAVEFAAGRPITFVGAGVTAASPGATLVPDPTTLLEAKVLEATLVAEPKTAVSELATTVDGMLTGTGMNCGTSTGMGIAIFLTFLTWWWWSFLPSSAPSSTAGMSALIRSPRSAGAFGVLSVATNMVSARNVANVAAGFMVNWKSVVVEG